MCFEGRARCVSDNRQNQPLLLWDGAQQSRCPIGIAMATERSDVIATSPPTAQSRLWSGAVRRRARPVPGGLTRARNMVAATADGDR